MWSFEAEERLSFGARRGATLSPEWRACNGGSDTASTGRTFYPTWGGGLHFVIKPKERMLINLEYAAGIEDNRGLYLTFGYAW